MTDELYGPERHEHDDWHDGECSVCCRTREAQYGILCRACRLVIAKDDAYNVEVISSAMLAEQRREFALDNAEDRPYHSIAHALVRRGLAWNTGMERPNGAYVTEAPFVRGRVAAYRHRDLTRALYVTEAPFVRGRVAADGDAANWCLALRNANRMRATVAALRGITR